MSSPRHSTGSGFGASAGGAALRGGIVIGIALLIGFLLLQQGIADDGGLAPSEATESASPESSDDATPDEDVTGSSTTLEGVGPGTEGTGTTLPQASLPPARPPNEVRVVVGNAAEINGAAGRTTEDLRALGYTTEEPTDASTVSDASTALYVEGFEAEAAKLMSELGGDPAAIGPYTDPAVISGERPDVNVVVLLGRDLAQPA